MYTNSDYTNQSTKKIQVKGMHLVRKMREVREQDRRLVMSEIENVQKTLDTENAPNESRASIYENAINIVDRHKMKLSVGCRR